MKSSNSEPIYEKFILKLVGLVRDQTLTVGSILSSWHSRRFSLTVERYIRSIAGFLCCCPWRAGHQSDLRQQMDSGVHHGFVGLNLFQSGFTGFLPAQHPAEETGTCRRQRFLCAEPRTPFARDLKGI